MQGIKLFFLAFVFSSLFACGGGDDGFGGDTGTPPGDGPGGSDIGDVPAAGVVGSVIISYSNQFAVKDNKNGTYGRKFSVLIRDQDGTPLPDDTRVDLQVVDTVIAQGTLGTSSDTATGTTLSITNVKQPDATPDDWTDGPTIDLATATVTRPGVLGGSNRRILADDLVIMTGSLETAPPESANFGQVDSRDVSRTVASTPTLSDQLTVSEAYLSSYPAYGGTTNYYIAASMLSAGVSGEITEDELTPGYALTKHGDGVATLWVTYASNIDHIHAGCAPAAIDKRVIPMGSSQPMLVAKVGDVTAVMRICFDSFAGYTVKAIPEKLTLLSTPGSAKTVEICAADGSDKLRNMPYMYIKDVNVTGDISAIDDLTYSKFAGTAPERYTEKDGCFTLEATTVAAAADGDKLTITVQIADGTVDIPIDIVAP